MDELFAHEMSSAAALKQAKDRKALPHQTMSLGRMTYKRLAYADWVSHPQENQFLKGIVEW